MALAAPPTPRTAGFVIRTLAYLVDAILLALVGGAFPFLLISNSGSSTSRAGGGSALLSLVYFGIFWSSLGGGRTLGMRLFRLQVIRESGELISVGRAVLRWIGLWISFAICFIGVILVAFDSRHQGLHDKIAGTLVIETGRAFSP